MIKIAKDQRVSGQPPAEKRSRKSSGPKDAAAVALGKRSWASMTKEQQRASVERANKARWPSGARKGGRAARAAS